MGDYINAIARFREGGALEETYWSDFEQGTAEAIRDLDVRLGGLDAQGAPQATPDSGRLQSAGDSGSLEFDVRALRTRLSFLKQLDEKLRLDPYLLSTAVERISSRVREDRRRRLVRSIFAAVAFAGVVWLLSSISPLSLLGGGQALVGTLLQVIPWLPR